MSVRGRGDLSPRDLIRQIGHEIVDLVFPPRCVLCRRPGNQLCAACLASLPRMPRAACHVCGRTIAGRATCSCKTLPQSPLDSLRSALLFEGDARIAIHKFKFENRPGLAEPLADIMFESWNVDPFPADIITAVPLHVARERERGYNQATLLARAFAGLVGNVAVTDLLARVRNTRTQVGLSAAEREKNVRGAFVCVAGRETDQSAIHTGPPAKRQVGVTTPSGQTSVQGKRVLVIDDVCTTGATLEACSVALKGAGARVVYGFTLARPG